MEPLGGHSATVGWDPGPRAQERLNALFKRYRAGVGDCLEPIVRQYNPMMLEGEQDEYRKMLELSAKMNVGRSRLRGDRAASIRRSAGT